jgi:secreted trypsin-like serine protease
MFKQTDGILKQIGIISFTPTADSVRQTAGDPLAYTRLSSYSNWIQDVMACFCSLYFPAFQ